MTAGDLGFYASAALALGGALIVVGARRTPIANAVGLVVSMAGVAGACGLAGAPGLGGLSLLAACGVALVVTLYTLEWVGTGRDALQAPAAGRVATRVLSAAVAVGLSVAVIDGVSMGGPRGVSGDAPGPALQALGVRLFGGEPVVVAVCGLLLLAALVASIALVSRRAS